MHRNAVVQGMCRRSRGPEVEHPGVRSDDEVHVRQAVDGASQNGGDVVRHRGGDVLADDLHAPDHVPLQVLSDVVGVRPVVVRGQQPVSNETADDREMRDVERAGRVDDGPHPGVCGDGCLQVPGRCVYRCHNHIVWPPGLLF